MVTSKSEVTVSITTSRSEWFSLRDVERFCEAARGAGAEGTQRIEVSQNGGVDSLRAVVLQADNMPVKVE